MTIDAWFGKPRHLNVLVGLPVAQRDILEAIHVVPDLVPANNLFADFATLKAALPNLLVEIRPVEKLPITVSGAPGFFAAVGND
jgi:hypothetical protein